MRRSRHFYHITSTDAVDSILKCGLRGGVNPRNRGETLESPAIYLLTDCRIKLTDHIAINQIWPCEDVLDYAVLAVDVRGITAPIERDHVSELVAGFHRVISQDVVAPRYVSVLRTRKLGFPGKRIAEMHRGMPGRITSWTEDDWAIARKWFDPRILEFYEQAARGHHIPTIV